MRYSCQWRIQHWFKLFPIYICLAIWWINFYFNEFTEVFWHSHYFYWILWSSYHQLGHTNKTFYSSQKYNKFPVTKLGQFFTKFGADKNTQKRQRIMGTQKQSTALFLWTEQHILSENEFMSIPPRGLSTARTTLCAAATVTPAHIPEWHQLSHGSSLHFGHQRAQQI